MKYLLIPILLGLMAMVVVSLVRGIVAFLETTRKDLETPGTGPTPSQLMQNKMMFNRIKYQALAILVVGVLLLMGR